MKNVLVCGYRDWAYSLYKLLDSPDYSLHYVSDKSLLEKIIEERQPEFIFFVGWSWMIKEDIINKYKCICLHPSKLPKYRGGSPLQHQIMNGETESAVTLFLMDKGIDTGDILYQESFSLGGNIKDIFGRIVLAGADGISEILKGNYKKSKQDNSKSSFYRRRTPDMSEITVDDIQNYTSEELFNKIRSLQSPYPNAFMVCKDGTKLVFEKVRVDNEK
tara:strand:- start:2079 stop:2732 length:654 start_codon:yes stop_codon:yes gene_type:complete